MSLQDGPFCWVEWLMPTPEQKAKWDAEHRRKEIMACAGCVVVVAGIVAGLVGIGVLIGRVL